MAEAQNEITNSLLTNVPAQNQDGYNGAVVVEIRKGLERTVGTLPARLSNESKTLGESLPDDVHYPGKPKAHSPAAAEQKLSLI